MILFENIIKQIVLESRKNRRGKGPWMVWFPRSNQKYISGPIKTKSELQALGSWLAADSPSNKGVERNWHNTIFKDYKSVVYRERSYTREEGRLLYSKLVKSNDWDAVDLGDPVLVKETELPSPIKSKVEKVEQIKLDL